jgi:hypothetical protein
MTRSLLLAATFAALLALRPTACEAQILIQNFVLTTNSVSFAISGTLPTSTPPNDLNTLYFVNTNVAASPGFALGDNTLSLSNSFSGTNALRTSFNPVGTGPVLYGDYFYVSFENLFVAEQPIFGTLNASWNTNAFNPAAVASINVFWGADNLLPINPAIQQPSRITGGKLLTTVVVPEPSTCALLAMSAAGALWWARRRR